MHDEINMFNESLIKYHFPPQCPLQQNAFTEKAFSDNFAHLIIFNFLKRYFSVSLLLLLGFLFVCFPVSVCKTQHYFML